MHFLNRLCKKIERTVSPKRKKNNKKRMQGIHGFFYVTKKMLSWRKFAPSEQCQGLGVVPCRRRKELLIVEMFISQLLSKMRVSFH